jgi:catechol 2,3-dioxygenase-like lactoylglutathione lyase family enzyme
MLPSQRTLFNIPREICYLNAASWSPLPIASQEAGRIGVARKGQPWLIDPALPAQQYERARRAAAKVINADPDDIALISSVSYGVAAAAKVLTMPAGSRVLIPPHDGHGPLHLAFAITAEALREWEERLRDQGVIIEGRTDWSRGGHSIYFRDPDGHLLELATPGLWATY